MDRLLLGLVVFVVAIWVSVYTLGAYSAVARAAEQFEPRPVKLSLSLAEVRSHA